MGEENAVEIFFRGADSPYPGGVEKIKKTKVGIASPCQKKGPDGPFSMVIDYFL